MDFFEPIISLLALIILEIVLGVDNLVFLLLLTNKLPRAQRYQARRWGLLLAMFMRFALLASAMFLVTLSRPLIIIQNLPISVRSIFLFFGGLFLITKAAQEIHQEIRIATIKKNPQPSKTTSWKSTPFKKVVLQVAIMDMIFSLDSILTAIGLTNQIWTMVLAITCAIIVMAYASDWASDWITKYPSIKMLALSFLILIGMLLIADGCSFHIPRAYVYLTMTFALIVEILNILRERNQES